MIFGRERVGFRSLIVQTIGFGALAVAAIGATLLGLRNDAFEEARRDQSDLAVVLGREIENATRGIENALDQTQAIVAASRPRSPDELRMALATPETTAKLQAIVGGAEQLEAAAVVGADGNIVVSSRSWPPPSFNIADNDDVRILKFNHTAGTYVSAPMLGRVSGQMTVFFARRIEGPGGAFLGVVHVAVKLTHYYQLYSAISALGATTFSLTRRDGVELVRYPVPKDGKTGVLPVDDDWRRSVQAGGGSFEAAGWFGNSRSLVTVRPLEGLPFVVNMVESDAEILSLWRERAMEIGGGALATLACAGLLAFAASAQFRRVLNSEASLAAKGEALAELNAHFASVLDNMPQGVALFSREKRLRVANRRYADMYDLEPHDIRPGTPFDDIVARRIQRGIFVADPQSYVDAKRRSVDSGVAGQALDRLSNGHMIFITRRPLEGGGWLTVHEDVTARQLAEDKIEHMALHDQLTGVANRALLLQAMQRRLADPGQRRLAILLVDLDEFKSVNDTYGHPFGDTLLKVVAERLRAAIGDAGLVARIGGDEFALLHCRGGEDEHQALAQAILEAIRKPFEIDGYMLIVRPSIGVARAPRDGDDVETLLRNADLALYKAKSEGRDRVGWFDPALEHGVREQRALKAELAEAILREQFEVHYQTIVDARSGETVEVEALVRWRHPERGMVRPDQFIPLAEQTGLIEGIGALVLRAACRDAARWRSDVGVAVNLSAAQFRKGDIAGLIALTLAETGLAPERLTVEVTETALMENIEIGREALSRIRALGVRVSLDDFGTGYSSLSYLQSLPLDFIKMDRSFVVSMLENPRTTQIVALIAATAKLLGAQTIAEGVETQEQLDLARATGCDLVQGYFFSKPQPKESLRLEGPVKTAQQAA